MGSKYKSVSTYETDAAPDDNKHGQPKKSKVDPPRTSNISTASSDDFFNLDPKLLPRFNEPKLHQENTQNSQSPRRVDQIVLTRDISFKSEDNDVWSQGGTSPISDITHESILQNMSPTRSPPVQVMERHNNSKYDPNRIPASAFGTKSSATVEWSTASNDSLFSIRLGNSSMSRDHSLHTRRVHGDLHKHEDSYKVGDPLKFKKPFPAMERRSDFKKSEVEDKDKSGTGGPHTDISKETIDPRAVKFSPIEISFSHQVPINCSDGSELDPQDFVAPIKKSGCTTCNCTNCRLTMCACTWPTCCCCSCRWPSCSCKWPSCCSCKWPSCSSCKWPSCCSCKRLTCCSCKLPSCSSCKWPSCSCKWLSCCSCKWPGCCSCKWPSCCLCKGLSCCSCKWPSCCSCKWPSCCSCKWPSCSSCSSCKLSSCYCCPCKWPSCCSCGWPSCPNCPSCPCGCPSCSSCSFMCFSWPSCCKCSGCGWPSCKCSSCSLPSISCWKCKPKNLFCCFSKISPEDKISDHHKRASNKRSRCCHFPSFSWSWFSCRCC